MYVFTLFPRKYVLSSSFPTTHRCRPAPCSRPVPVMVHHMPRTAVEKSLLLHHFCPYWCYPFPGLGWSPHMHIHICHGQTVGWLNHTLHNNRGSLLWSFLHFDFLHRVHCCICGIPHFLFVVVPCCDRIVLCFTHACMTLYMYKKRQKFFSVVKEYVYILYLLECWYCTLYFAFCDCSCS